MTYFGLTNLSSQDTFTFTEPDKENLRVLPNEPAGMDKEARRKWLTDPATDTCVFSIWEGLNTKQRINTKADNPPWKMHGLVVDYDAPSPGNLSSIKDNVEKILSATPSLFPQWGVTTPSGHHRLIWEFEAPVNVGESGDAFILENFSELSKLLKLPLLLAGLDEAALKKPSTYYDISGIWERFNPLPLPTSDVQGAFFKAVSKTSKGKQNAGLPEIPMDVIFAELEAKFPGKWPKGVPFTDGVQGPAVWHPDAKNQATTIYRPWGAYCFSAEDKLFRSYTEILGKDFTRKFEENKIGAATEAIYYIPRIGYYRRWPDEMWRSQPKEDLILYLAGSQGLSRNKAQGGGLSEVELALHHIQQSRVLDGAIPIVYDKRDIIVIAGKKFLNLARVKVMEPDPNPVMVWGQGFPWTAKWLGSMFGPSKQLVYLLTWLKLFYTGARNGELRQGHAIFMVGGTGMGKTLMNARWIPMLMGGGSEAGDYLVKGENFCKELLEVGHWHIDDSQAATDRIQHTKFSERVKSLIANPLVAYHPKYVDRQMVPFSGRLMVTLNEDPASLLMIPDLDRNIEDKLIVFRLRDEKTFKFGPNADNERQLRKEAPFFLSWLMTWNPPKHLVGNSMRWGMRNYIHPTIRKEAVANSFDSDIFGVLDILWDTDNDFVELKQKGEPWVGTAAALTSIIGSYTNTRNLIHGMTVRGIGMRLAKLAKTAGSSVRAIPNATKSKSSSSSYALYPTHL